MTTYEWGKKKIAEHGGWDETAETLIPDADEPALAFWARRTVKASDLAGVQATMAVLQWASNAMLTSTPVGHDLFVVSLQITRPLTQTEIAANEKRPADAA